MRSRFGSSMRFISHSEALARRWYKSARGDSFFWFRSTRRPMDIMMKRRDNRLKQRSCTGVV